MTITVTLESASPRAYWEWLTYAVEWLVCWHEINPCTFHHFGWRFWHWVPCWAYCEAMEGGDIAEQSYLDSFRKVEYSDNGRVAAMNIRRLGYAALVESQTGTS